MNPVRRLYNVGPVAFVLKGYPRLSETFIAQEIAGLEDLGLDIRLISLRHPTDKYTHPIHARIKAPVSYLPEYLHDEPPRVVQAWFKARRLPGYHAARKCWLADLKRDFTRNRVRRYGQAIVLAAELPDDVRHIHAHFMHTPASVARYAAMMRGLTWSFSAHAKDIWTSPTWEKVEKIADCSWGVTCTRYGLEHLQKISVNNQLKLHLQYHGLDLNRFGQSNQTDATKPDNIVITVGRAVEKKGLDTILEALAKLPKALPWRFVHIGGGPLLSVLKAKSETLGIAERVEWRGALPQTEVLAALRTATLFVLASRIGRDGDRDGLPNVLMEAASQKVPIVATRVAAIPEFIENGKNGLLCSPDDSAAMSSAIRQILENPDQAGQFAEAAANLLQQKFSFSNTVDELAVHFEEIKAV